MLPDSTVPGSLTGLLTVFRPCFTTPTFSTFSGLVVGLIAQTRRRTVCGMLLGVGLERVWHHARAHRFFATARWCADSVGLALLDLIVDRLLPDGSAITVVIDDTLFKRAGRKVFGVFWHHDGAAKGPKPIGFGNCWVVAGVVVVVPFLSRPVCLPVLARLWHPRRTGKLAHARVMVELVAARYPDRQVHAVGDAAYVGDHLRGLDKHVTWTSRLKVTSVLHALAPPRTGRSGRPRTKGPRLGTPTDLAATACWRKTQVRRYGRVDLVWIAEIVCLWYGSFRGQTVRVVLVRDDKPRTRDRDDRGYGLPLVTTDLSTPAEHLVTRYAWRWAIEAVGDRGGVLSCSPGPRCWSGPQLDPPGGRTHRAVRAAVPEPGHRLVRHRRARSCRCGRASQPLTLVPDEDRTVVRGHDDQAPARHHRREISTPSPPPANPRRNSDRPRGLGRSRDLIDQRCETRGSLTVAV
jgi:hypothetical protein